MKNEMAKATTEKEMSFLDHLEELRWHLIRATFAVVILATLAFIFKDFIHTQMKFIMENPTNNYFDMQPIMPTKTMANTFQQSQYHKNTVPMFLTENNELKPKQPLQVDIPPPEPGRRWCCAAANWSRKRPDRPPPQPAGSFPPHHRGLLQRPQ